MSNNAALLSQARICVSAWPSTPVDFRRRALIESLFGWEPVSANRPFHMYELIVESEFSAAHRLREYNGACENLHGHNWLVEMTVAGEGLNDLGMLVDFRDIKAILNDAVRKFDHVYINELPAFQEQNPTTENLARVIHEDADRRMPEGVHVRSVTVWESPRCRARYSVSDGGSPS